MASLNELTKKINELQDEEMSLEEGGKNYQLEDLEKLYNTLIKLQDEMEYNDFKFLMMYISF